MSHFVHTPYFRAGPRSVTNPKRFIRQNSASSLNGWSISTAITSPRFDSSKTSKKTAAFASLGVNGAFPGALISAGIHSAENCGRSISLFAPSSCVVHDSVYNADLLDPYSTFPTAMASTNITPSYSLSSSLSTININMSLALPVSIPLPPSPTLAADATDVIDTSVAPLPLMIDSIQDGAPPASIRGRRKDLRQILPSICPAVSKSHSQSSTSSEASMPSPTARSRRSASLSRTPPMHIISSTSKHMLNVQLPAEIQPEMVTISAKKGDRLAVVADAWHMEEDCHYEWQIRFAPYDIDMNSIRASFDDKGHLTINVQRRAQYYASSGGWGTRVI